MALWIGSIELVVLKDAFEFGKGGLLRFSKTIVMPRPIVPGRVSAQRMVDRPLRLHRFPRGLGLIRIRSEQTHDGRMRMVKGGEGKRQRWLPFSEISILEFHRHPILRV